MSLTPTTQISLGFKAPDFKLLNPLNGNWVSFSDIKGKYGTVVMFICNHCPYVIHVRAELIRIANDYLAKGIGFVAISANDVVNYPEDAPEKMAELSKAFQFPFPYLYDESQAVAKAYDAACTPDFSVFNDTEQCVYRGRLDGSTPGNGVPVTGQDLRKVCDQLLAGQNISDAQLPSMGCNIKWKRN